ncbi:MAG: MBL fold metallo-hydrolase [Candidatus Uhrbacteria bacterium]
MKLSFHGAVRGVTGSCHMLETDAGRLLFDCGMFQGYKFAEERNAESFGFDPASIDAVFVTHAHADHTGRLPKLIHDGYSSPIYMTPPTRPLTRLIMEDSYHIMKENYKRDQEKMLYDEEDVDMVMKLTKSVNYHHVIEPLPGVTVMFHDAGHILGSAYVTVEAEGQRILFSGDLGNSDTPILPDPEPISSADIIITETTYGDRVHEAPEERQNKLKEALLRTVRRQGVLMIPSFSVERTQELLYELDQILLHEVKTNVPIFLDSPLSIKATAVYRHYQNYLRFNADILQEPDRDFFAFPNLRETLTREESMAINDIPGPKIIIAGSGMMHGGRIMHHLKRYLQSADNHLLIIGYQVEGTLGRRLFDGIKKVRIYGDDVQVQARVSAIGSFSAHGDQRQLTKWLQPEDKKIPKKIFLVHGDEEVKYKFAAHLHRELETQTEIVIPEFNSVHQI